MQDKKNRTRTGVVVKQSGSMTVQVSIDFLVKHPKYGKYQRRRTRLAVHDQLNQGRVGDLVEVAECRPCSKTKRWRLVKVVQSAGSSAPKAN